MEAFDYEELVKATDNFSPSNLIGRGSHGSVYRASLVSSDGCRTVAVKRLSHFHGDISKKLANEISILSSLSPHPHIVGLLGSAQPRCRPDGAGDHYPLLVMEFMPHGSVHDLLHASADLPSWPARFQIILLVARALEHLHGSEPPVIHRDVKSANILLDAEWNAKLSDFGLAVAGDGSPSPAGTIGYIDPSYTCPSKLSTKNDIFSFGVLALEILSGRKAIDVSKEPSSIVDWATSVTEKRQTATIHDSRVPLPATLEGDFRHLLHVAMRCLSCDELSQRPSARELVSELEKRSVSIVEIQTPSWVSPLWSMIMLSRRRWKLASKCQGHGHDVEVGPTTRGKLSLRDVLANITEEEKG